MASIFIGVNRGAPDSPDALTEGAATGATDIEVRIDTGKGWTRQEARVALERIYEALIDGRTAYFTL